MALGTFAKPTGRLAGPLGRYAGDPALCCYQQSRLCSDNSLSGLWLLVSDIPASNTIVESGICYFFDPTDLAIPCPGTLHATPPTSVVDCSDAACGGTALCAGDCSGLACPSAYTLTVAGLGGVRDCCTAIAPDFDPNGVFTLNQNGTLCEWDGPFMFHSGTPFCGTKYILSCSVTDCLGNLGARRWKITGLCNNTLWAEVISSAVCPPLGAYTVTCNDCGGTPTFTLS